MEKFFVFIKIKLHVSCRNLCHTFHLISTIAVADNQFTEASIHSNDLVSLCKRYKATY